MQDPFNLQRFVAAQTESYEMALSEIASGQKCSHWIWYIFPQITGLGQSETARRYSIASLAEAKAYLAHPVLGPRLRTCLETLQTLPESKTAEAVFGQLDAMKLRSSLNLFIAAGGGNLFQQTLDRWFGSQKDHRTLELLQASVLSR